MSVFQLISLFIYLLIHIVFFSLALICIVAITAAFLLFSAFGNELKF